MPLAVTGAGVGLVVVGYILGVLSGMVYYEGVQGSAAVPRVLVTARSRQLELAVEPPAADHAAAAQQTAFSFPRCSATFVHGVRDIDFAAHDAYGGLPGFTGPVRMDTRPEDWAAFTAASTKAALSDGRGLLTASLAFDLGGLGNNMFAAAGISVLAKRTGRLAVVSCQYNNFLSRVFYKLPCINPADAAFTDISDRGVDYQFSAEFLHSLTPDGTFGRTHLDFNQGYLQNAPLYESDMDTVCWALQPSPALERDAATVFAEALAHVDVTEHTRVVAVHVRRGDYQAAHGWATVAYYHDAWESVLARVALEGSPDMLRSLVVMVFSYPGDGPWAQLKFPGAQHVVFVPNDVAWRSAADDIHLFAMALADFFVLANSTYSWWAHFLALCRRTFSNWATLPRAIATLLPFEAVVLPFKFMQHPIPNPNSDRSDMFNLLVSNRYLVPNARPLFEENYTRS